MSTPPPRSRPDLAIGCNTALWMAGHVLTSGAFLSYFAYDLGGSALMLAGLAAAPELVGASGLASRWVWRWVGNRRRAWLITTILARVFTLCIPLAGWPMLERFGVEAPWLMLALVAISQLFQGVATTLYFSWLADLTDVRGWGPLFSRRNVVALAIQMTVPLGGAWLRDTWRSELAPEQMWWAYAVVFTVGVALLLLSILPMFLVRDDHPTVQPVSEQVTASTWSLLANPAIRTVLAHAWCLAFANGLTQAVFFKYQIGIVKLSLTGYFLLADVMLAIQIVTSLLAGRCRTAAEHRRTLFRGALVASCALPFWMLASRDQWWWLIGAFACWGAFGAVNVAGPNVMLSFSRPGETTAHLALFRQVSGTIAGLSGILGGWLLDLGLGRVTPESRFPLWPFWILFGLSYLGRVLAALLVLRIPVPDNDRLSDK